ncbi:hypothetical protein TNIN_410021 [Trichonephila inaurata madagascariensis]|uniref:Uncharacterized protein n=1 Tax=Trichonephila inaurata madagascariensis TaxID=2747483 RepID=A0A8X6X3R8_9ARAC|nr:hypothetical protein TNIN_410021 [Trichonephila inaurata madagascariensis]
MEGTEVKKKRKKGKKEGREIRIYPLPVDFRVGFGKQATPLRPQMTGLPREDLPFCHKGELRRLCRYAQSIRRQNVSKIWSSPLLFPYAYVCIGFSRICF